MEIKTDIEIFNDVQKRFKGRLFIHEEEPVKWVKVEDVINRMDKLRSRKNCIANDDWRDLYNELNELSK